MLAKELYRVNAIRLGEQIHNIFMRRLLSTKTSMEILYIEDDIDDVELFSEALYNIDPYIKFCYAVHSDEALKKLSDYSIRPDAIFADFHLPAIDGLECIKSIKQLKDFKHTPIIILSTTISSKMIDDFNKMGVYYFLSKSAILDDIEPALKVIINSLCKGDEKI